MALGPDWVSQSWCFLWMFTLLLSESQTKKTQTYYMHGIDCGNKKYIGGATVYSHREENSQYYMDENECKITFKADNEGWRIMLRFLELDIPDIDPNNGICNDALYIYDSEDVFTGAMLEAGGNYGLCGIQPPPHILVSTGPFMTIHFRTNAKGDIKRREIGRGFKFIVTAFSEDFKKYNSCGTHFQCANKNCIDEDLKCDTVDHCGDNSDEAMEGFAQCGVKDDGSFLNRFLALGVTASVTITVGSLIVLIVCIIAAVCCCKKLFCKPPPEGTTNAPHSTTPNNLAANGAPSYNQSQSTCNSSYPPSREYSDYPHSHQGYFPMQPVYHPANQHGSALYTAAYTRDALIANTHNSGSAYSSQSHSHSQPPSHHRSYTPTSSRSGKSTRSNNSTSVTYSQGTEKIALPINL